MEREKQVEKRDYLYHYTKTFFSEIVKETILIENWEERDFDHRYVEYADVFVKIMDNCFAKGASKEFILEYLSQRRKHIVKLFNKKMGEHFKREFATHGYNKEEADRMIPKNLFKGDEIGIDTLIKFRDLEEKIFTENKEKSK